MNYLEELYLSHACFFVFFKSVYMKYLFFSDANSKTWEIAITKYCTRGTSITLVPLVPIKCTILQ